MHVMTGKQSTLPGGVAAHQDSGRRGGMVWSKPHPWCRESQGRRPDGNRRTARRSGVAAHGCRRQLPCSSRGRLNCWVINHTGRGCQSFMHSLRCNHLLMLKRTGRNCDHWPGSCQGKQCVCPLTWMTRTWMPRSRMPGRVPRPRTTVGRTTDSRMAAPSWRPANPASSRIPIDQRRLPEHASVHRCAPIPTEGRIEIPEPTVIGQPAPGFTGNP